MALVGGSGDSRACWFACLTCSYGHP